MPESILRFLRPAVLIAGIVAAFGAWGARLEYVSATHATHSEVGALSNSLSTEDRVLAEEMRQVNAKLDMLIRFACRPTPEALGC